MLRTAAWIKRFDIIYILIYDFLNPFVTIPQKYIINLPDLIIIKKEFMNNPESFKTVLDKFYR